MKTPILGSAYVARSINAADNRMVNLFPEVIQRAAKRQDFSTAPLALTFCKPWAQAQSALCGRIRPMAVTSTLCLAMGFIN
jgi:hypothetical protein